MSTIAVLVFPYSGYAAKTTRKELFWKTVEIVRTCLSHDPVVVVNQDTVNSRMAADFYRDPRAKTLDHFKTWSVDTCQMWLAGWGYVFENYPKATRIVQLPGDLDAVAEPNAFFGNLRSFLAVGKDPDISIGDYDLPDPFGAKHLIDHYGTYPLLANWFPDLTRRILRESINRVRSEFLNLKIKTLKDLLKNRKFAYEQTLNLLIRSYDHDNDEWIHDVRRHPLGSLQDDASFRGYRECLDQIERSERMLKLLWRVLNKPSDQKDYPRFVERYHVLDRISTSIREAAATTIRSLLGLRSY